MKVMFHKLFANLKKNNKKTQKHCRSSGLKAFGTVVMLFSLLMLCMPAETAEAAPERVTEYQLKTGVEINAALKTLANGTKIKYSKKDLKITAIKYMK